VSPVAQSPQEAQDEPTAPLRLQIVPRTSETHVVPAAHLELGLEQSPRSATITGAAHIPTQHARSKHPVATAHVPDAHSVPTTQAAPSANVPVKAAAQTCGVSTASFASQLKAAIASRQAPSTAGS
jgi:hypothetical protein